LSCIPSFKSKLFRDKGYEALLGCVFDGKVANNSYICQEICRTFAHLSYVFDYGEAMISTGTLALALRALFESHLLHAKDSQLLVLLILRNLSESLHARRYLLEQELFKLIVTVIQRDVDEFISQQQQVSPKPDPSLPLVLTEREKDEEESVRSLHSTDDSGMGASQDIKISPKSADRPRIRSLGYAATVRIVFNLCQVAQLHSQLVTHGVMSLLCKICVPVSAPDIVSEGSHSPNAKQSSKDVKTPQSPAHINTSSNTLNKSVQFELPQGKQYVTNGVSTETNTGGQSQAVYITGDSVDLIAKSLHLLSQSPQCHENMVRQGAMSLFRALIFSASHSFNIDAVHHTIKSTTSAHIDTTTNHKIMSSSLSNVARCEISGALSQLSQTKSCREPLVAQGACELLIALSLTSDSNTQAQCATALAFLSEITLVRHGVVASLLLLSLSLEEQNSLFVSANQQAGGDERSASIALSQSLLKDPNSAMNAALIQSRRDRATTTSVANNVAAATALTSGGNTTADAIVGNSAANSNVAASPSNAQSLTTLLRELMADKKKFDLYLDGLQKKNRENLHSNSFVPKTTPQDSVSHNNNSISSASLASPTVTADSSSGLRLRSKMMSASSLAKEQSVTRQSMDSVVSDAQHLNIASAALQYTNLCVSSVHGALLTQEEAEVLHVQFESFLFVSPSSFECYPPEAGGLSNRVLSELPLPSIPPDRDLEPPNRHDELLKIPVNQVPLPKDTQPPKFLDHHRSTTIDFSANSLKIDPTSASLEESFDKPNSRKSGECCLLFCCLTII
jgi:hypothetical protein